MPYKVTVWGAGQKGSLAVKEAIEHPDLELVGVLVFSDAKAGRGAAELYGGTTPSDIITTQSQECILSLDADVVIHARRREPDPTPMNDEVCAILKSGKNVISIPASSGPGLTARTFLLGSNRLAAKAAHHFMERGSFPGSSASGSR
jgi:hypothetical protein